MITKSMSVLPGFNYVDVLLVVHDSVLLLSELIR